jgi:hypothetical protein
MRWFLILLAWTLPIRLLAQDTTKPLTPEEALKKVNQQITVQMEVKSTGGRTARYLNSETDFRSSKNFAIFIPQAVLEKFKKASIDEPATYYKSKTIQVTGLVVRSESKDATGQPQIRVEDPSQIKVIEKAAKSN